MIRARSLSNEGTRLVMSGRKTLEKPACSGESVLVFRLRLWLLIVCGLAVFRPDACQAAESGRSDVQCLSVIFGDQVGSNVKGIRQSAVRLSPNERYEFLLRTVLPEDDKRGIRIDIDFAPACPSPAAAQLLSLNQAVTSRAAQTPATRLSTGAELISPAIDLVDAASESGRLHELRNRVSTRQSDDPDFEPSQLAMLALIEMAAGNFEAAQDTIGRLYACSADHPVTKPERGPIGVVIWTGIRHPQTIEAARDLTFLAYEQARNSQGPRSERWHRQLYSMKHALQRLVEARTEDSSGSENPSPLRHWIPVSRMTAETCGKGFPLARWETSPGQASHVTCHDHDYLFYAIPLTGDFEVEADLTTFGYRDIQLAAGSFWAGPGYSHDACLNGNFRAEHPTISLTPKLTRMLDWMRVRIVVRDGLQTTFINGRNVFSRPHPAGSDPWIAIHSPWYTNGEVRDLRVICDSDIPSLIDLAAVPDIPGWLPYFDESAGHNDSDWRLVSTPDSPPVLIGRRRSGLDGSSLESLLRYHRPIAEDGIISYEFFYSSDQFDVHPSLGRLAFLLDPSGVNVHWITDGRFDSTGLDPANLLAEPDNRRGPATLPLKPDDWNSLEMEVTGDLARLLLNGQLVYERPIEATNQRTFGLFHFADRSEVRVRNIRWSGNWPRVLPAIRKQELAGHDTDEIDASRDRLAAGFQHDFSQGVPTSSFDTLNNSGKLQLELNPDGVRVTRPGGSGWPNTSIVPKLQVHGDFDITAEFADFSSQLGAEAAANLQLYVELDDKDRTECRVFRTRSSKPSNPDEHLAQAALFTGPQDKRGYDFMASPAEEATSGRLRLARRGPQIHLLLAEADSPHFRLLSSRPVATSSSRNYGIRLMLETPKGETSSVTWKHIDVRADSITGAGAGAAYSLAKLNEQRDQLAVKFEHDFRNDDSLESFLTWGSHGRLTSKSDGLQIEVPGSDDWMAAGLASRMQIEGDFDISLDLEILQIEKAAPGHETSVYLETELKDPLQTAIRMAISVDSTGQRNAEMQMRRHRPDGGISHQILNSREAATIHHLRLARRGSIVYLLFQDAPENQPQIAATAEVGTEPVPATFLRALIHTGGAGRETVVRFKSLKIHADSLSAK